MADSDSTHWIDYDCGICGIKAHADADWPLPQCKICKKSLCRKCNNHQYCTQHWQALDQAKK